ncbi:hypothetical protein QBC36DRAFT_335754 [Triangularia setosa]|uniref:Myb-like domain-containing protein n=1 Tax=Triangularia setosa TaxID=2587417 RepID=A0AAN6W131_9PEZI|nr:hypothetical protein QBC36DRAFT_335754 [Podospora setosa]
MLLNKNKLKPKVKPVARRPPPASKPSTPSTPASTPAASAQQDDANPTPPPPSVPAEAASSVADNTPPKYVETSLIQGQTQATGPRAPSPTIASPSTLTPEATQSQNAATQPVTETSASPKQARSKAPKPVRAPQPAAVSVSPPVASTPALTPAPTPSVPELALSNTPTTSSSPEESAVFEAQFSQDATPNTEDVAAAVAEKPIEPSTSGPSQPPKPKPKPRAPRKRKANTANDEPIAEAGEDAEPDEASTSSTPAPRKRVRKRAAPLPGEEGYEEHRAATAARKPRQKRTRAVAAAKDGETPEGQEAEEENGSRANSRPPRAQREATPENAEEQVVDENEFKMADLAKDLRIGKKFSLHDTLLERERLKKLKMNEKRKRAKSNGADEPENNDGQPQPLENGTHLPGGNADDEDVEYARPVPVSVPVGEQYQIIDGEIVLNQSSLQIDRHARAREAEGNLEEVEEDDFTNHTTQQTYLRRALKPGQWSDADTDQFYWALSRFGTDFELISKMFTGKTRKHIKLKFNREERQSPERIKKALVGELKQPMNIEEVQQKTKQEFETTDDIQKELEEQQKEFEEKEAQVQREKKEEEKKKEEKMLKELEDAKNKSGRRKKKQVVEQGLW